MLIYISVQVVVGLWVLWSLVRGRHAVMWACGFLAPLGGLSVAAGVNWTWPKMIPLIIGVELTLRGGWRRLRAFPGIAVLGAYLGYVGLVTVVLGLGDSETAWRIENARSLGWGPAQTTYRQVIQYAVAVSLWSVPALVFAASRDEHAADAAIRGFLYGAVLSVLVGFYQVFAQVAGLPWLDPGELSELASGNLGLRDRLQEFAVSADRSVVRLYGLGGEPKHTAAASLIAVAVLFVKPSLMPRRSLAALAILLVGILLTFSTSGWLALVAVVGLAVFLGRSQSNGLTRVGAAVALLLGMASMFSASALQAIVDERVVSRLGGGAYSIFEAEHKDGAYYAFLADRPLRAAIGLGAGAIDFYSVDYVPAHYVRPNSMVTPTYFPSRVGAEGGLMGVLLLAGLARAWSRHLRSAATAWRSALFLTLVLGVLLPFAVLTATLFVLGAICVHAPARRAGVSSVAPQA